MANDSLASLFSVLRQHQILAPPRLNEMTAQLAPHSLSLQGLAQAVLQHGWLTPFQVNIVFAGRTAELRRGPYVLLERLGEGGTGQVFKARDTKLERDVALKVLRAELVADSEVVGRFYREFKVATQLPEHPHLLHAFEAGPCGATHLLAMEYVTGIDLDRMVKQSGPLDVEQACTLIRQAALGLQHAHEHGLVHRDIKPSNLLVTSDPGTGQDTVKILDLGLARLQGDNKNCPRENTFLTSDGAVTLGTIDYQAPEQALDFHRADIRADIYSLGCTFFYLLTGKPPFGSGPLALKLMRHQQAQPPSLKERRPEVSDRLAAIVARMLAKKPADRYQTPGQVAAALAGLNRPPRQSFLPTFRVPAALAGWQRPTRRHLLRILMAASGCAALLFLVLMVRSAGVAPDTGKVAVPLVAPAPLPGSVEATVPEARDYQLVYDLNLAKLARDIVYDEDRHAKITQPIERIAYFIELRPKDGEMQYLYVSMDAFTKDVKKIGVPSFASGASFQMNVAKMNVYSNVKGIVTGTGIAGGNIEFWPNNYGPANAMNVPNGDSGKYDFGDQKTDPVDGYGSMQVHNHDARQTLFAVNHWREGERADIGIGNSPNGNPDWTFLGNAGSYRTKRLRVLVQCR